MSFIGKNKNFILGLIAFVVYCCMFAFAWTFYSWYWFIGIGVIFVAVLMATDEPIWLIRVAFIILGVVLLSRLTYVYSPENTTNKLETSTQVKEIQFLDDTNVVSYIVSPSGRRTSEQLTKEDYLKQKSNYSGQFLKDYKGNAVQCYLNTYVVSYDGTYLESTKITNLECY